MHPLYGGVSPSFHHLVAFGNSDQASFRDPRVRDALDVMTVPGTIASYYDEATAAFVLSSQIPYLIDPRTPLFQEFLAKPRASHYSLAAWHGESVSAQLRAGGELAHFPASFFSGGVVDQMVREVVDRQRSYAGNATRVTKKLDRYARLLAAAMEELDVPLERASPTSAVAILAPYFAVRGEGDAWWKVMGDIWDACARLSDPSAISPVLCVGEREGEPGTRVTTISAAAVLGELLPQLPEDLARTVYIWITSFDERAVPEEALNELWNVIEAASPARNVINLYGGYFSICLRHAGLAGFGSGLTYSEARAWPALSSTGSAPPRYYVRELHAFMPPAGAANLIENEPFFACPCAACVSLAERGFTIASMPYHDLKLHFALSRQWELDTTAMHRPTELAAMLRHASSRLEAVRGRLVGRPPGAHLLTWANVLDFR